MKRLNLMLGGAALGLALMAAPAPARAQSGSVAQGPDPSVLVDVELEKDAKKNLEVARHYFRMKKAYLASRARTEELIAGYPKFARLDEALYIAGMSSLYLAEGKGKQAAPKTGAEFTPENLRLSAREYLSRLVNEFPESKFRGDAEAALAQLGGVKKEGEPTPNVGEKPQLKRM